MIEQSKYFTLLVRVYALEEQLRKNPPQDLAEYQAAVKEIKELWLEINEIIAFARVSSLRAAHELNQRAWEEATASSSLGSPVWPEAE